MFFPALLLASSAVASVRAAFPDGVIATGTQGVTNPPVATMPTTINQKSMARLLSVNSIDDFCLFAPPTVAGIPDTETVEVAWCTLPRNNARVIPDGTFTGVTFLKTDFYVQIMGTGDLTKLNIAAGDTGGGELDPHGAEGTGNPVGGNVTTTVADGIDEPIAEWMLYISANQFCLRACYNANSTYSAAFMCWHELDVMGCEFVMPGVYHGPGTFETCDADVAYPPGWYPTVVDGTTSFSTFAQFFTGVFNGANGQPTPYTVGDTVTPTAPFSIPSSSNCVTKATISNGLAASLLTADAVGTAPPEGFSSSAAAAPTSNAGAGAGGSASAGGGSASAGAGTLSTAKKTSSAGTGAGAKSTASASLSGSGSAPTGSSAAFRGATIGYGHSGEYAGIALISLISVLAAVGLLH